MRRAEQLSLILPSSRSRTRRMTSASRRWIRSLYVFEGYTIDDPWVIVLALAHNYERLKQVPSDESNGVGVTDIGDQYARGTRQRRTRSPTGSVRRATTPGLFQAPWPTRCC